jgi:hypothetical protein
VFDQERGGDHAHPVVHPARVPEFAHAGVDDGITGAPPLPRAQRPRVGPPRELRVFGPQRLVRRVRKMEEQVVGELAPHHLAQEGLDASRSPVLLVPERNGVPDLPRGDLSEMKVRRETRSGGEGGLIAIGVVAGGAPVVELIQHLRCASLARRPGRAHAAGPVDGWKQVEVRQGHAGGPAGGGGEAGGRGQGGGKGRKRQQMLVEWREHLEGPARLVADGRGFAQQRAGKTAGFDARREQVRLQARVAGDGRGFVTTVPVDCGGTGFTQQLGEDRRRIALAKDQPRPNLAKRGVQGGERPVKPPPGGAAGFPCPFAARVEYKYRKDRPAGCGGGVKGFIVRQAQVLAEPDEDRCPRHDLSCWAAGGDLLPARVRATSRSLRKPVAIARPGSRRRQPRHSGFRRSRCRGSEAAGRRLP